MGLSRRAMVAGIAGTTAVGAVSGGHMFMGLGDLKRRLAPEGNGRRGVPLISGTADDWSVQMGSLFTLDTGQVVELTGIRRFPEHPGRPRNLRSSAFMTTFMVKEGDAPSGSRIYRLSHSEGGVFDLFLNHDTPDQPMRMTALLN